MMNFKSIYRSLLLCLLVFAGAVTLTAQQDKSKRPSPPAAVSATIGDATITIDYSQPAVKGRELWGKLVPYGKVWRTGANEATTFETSKAITVNGKELAAGKYALFTIPNEKEWVFIFNSEPNQWGHYNYDESKDVLRIEATPSESDEFMERMTFTIEEDEVELHWGDLSVGFEVSAKTAKGD